MKVAEMKGIVQELFKRIEEQDEYYVYGLRFEDKDREVGEICENSRNNIDREDERDFPEYGTEEYAEMEEMDGTSAWDVDSALMQIEENLKYNTSVFGSNHAYIIAGHNTGWEQNNGLVDDGEVVIQDSVVLHKIY